MNASVPRQGSVLANAIYSLLNPLPFGCFAAALIFDVAYARSADIIWIDGAAWLVTFGLLLAIVPRLINLVQVWITKRRPAPTDKLDFWLNLVAIALAILNAFVHSRDAYAAVPANVWLSACTVTLLSIGHIVIAVRGVATEGLVHE